MFPFFSPKNAIWNKTKHHWEKIIWQSCQENWICEKPDSAADAIRLIRNTRMLSISYNGSECQGQHDEVMLNIRETVRQYNAARNSVTTESKMNIDKYGRVIKRSEETSLVTRGSSSPWHSDCSLPAPPSQQDEVRTQQIYKHEQNPPIQVNKPILHGSPKRELSRSISETKYVGQ